MKCYGAPHILGQSPGALTLFRPGRGGGADSARFDFGC